MSNAINEENKKIVIVKCKVFNSLYAEVEVLFYNTKESGLV